MTRQRTFYYKPIDEAYSLPNVEDEDYASRSYRIAYRYTLMENKLTLSSRELQNPENTLPYNLYGFVESVAKYMAFIAPQAITVCEKIANSGDPDYKNYIPLSLAELYEKFEEQAPVKLHSRYIGSFPDESSATVEMVASVPTANHWPAIWEVWTPDETVKLEKPVVYIRIGLDGIHLRLQVRDLSRSGRAFNIFETGFTLKQFKKKPKKKSKGF